MMNAHKITLKMARSITPANTVKVSTLMAHAATISSINMAVHMAVLMQLKIRKTKGVRELRMCRPISTMLQITDSEGSAVNTA